MAAGERMALEGVAVTDAPWWEREAPTIDESTQKDIAAWGKSCYELGRLHGGREMLRGLQHLGLFGADELDTFRFIGDVLLQELGLEPQLGPRRLPDMG